MNPSLTQLVRGARRSRMPVRGPSDSLTQGVSQMPPHLRPVGTCTEQVNGWSSPVEGLRKRQPARWLGNLFSPCTDFFASRFVVLGDERYMVVVVPFDGRYFLRVYDLSDLSICAVDVHGTGLSTSHTSYPDGDSTGWVVGDSTSYLANTKFLRGFTFINNGPLGLLLNRNAVVSMASTTSPAREEGALLFIQGVAFDVTYEVYLNGASKASYTTPLATDTNNTLDQTLVANDLKDQINAADGGSTWVATQQDYIVYVKRADGAAFDVRLDDGRGNVLARAIGESTTTTSELPILAKDGFITKTRNEPGAEIDDRWFRFTTFDGGTGIGEGTWEETVQPGIPFELDEATMPLVIWRAGPKAFFLGPADGAAESATLNGTAYTYDFPDWGDRTAGNEETVPDPPFVGKPIRDHTIFRSRYMVCAGNAVVFSEVDDIFNFFIDSTTQVVDTDAFDLQAQSDLSTDLSWLTVVDEAVLAFSSDVQFTVRAAGDSDVLSSRSSVILKVSSIEINTNIRPRVSGGNVLFATNEFGFTNVRELQAFDSQQRRLGLNLGGSLNTNLFTPKYLEGVATYWDVGENLDYVAVMTDGDQRTLYIYKYLWGVSGTSVEKLQSSWSKWQFGEDVVNLFFDENSLVVFHNSADGVEVAAIDAEELLIEDDPNILLDRRISYPESSAVTASYDAITDTTTFTLPYSTSGTARAISRAGNNDLAPGLLLGSTTSGTDIVCDEKGDFRGLNVAFGEDYNFHLELTPAYLRVGRSGSNNQQQIGDLSGRLIVNYWEIYYFQSGFFEVVVDRAGRASSTVQFRSRSLGVEGNTIGGSVFLDSGSFRVPIHAKNTDATITVQSSNWLPLTLTGAAWEGSYSNRSARQ